MTTSRKGFSILELLVVMAMIGILTAMVVPKLRLTPRTRVRLAAQQLAADLELARGRALASRSITRVVFTPGLRSYTGYLDFNRDSVFALTVAETDSLRGFGSRTLDTDVQYGRAGGVPDLPFLPGNGTITLAGNRVDFDTRGVTMPFGNSGVIYLTHANDPTAVAAVSITGAAGVRAWIFAEGVWQ